MVVAAAVAESNSDSGGSNGDSDGWVGIIGSEGNSNGRDDNSNDGKSSNNGSSCDSDGDNDVVKVAAMMAAVAMRWQPWR